MNIKIGSIKGNASGVITINGQSISVGPNSEEIIIDGVKFNIDNAANVTVVLNGNVDKITTSNGDVEVIGECGEVRTSNGEVHCGTVKGSVHTSNGQVNVHGGVGGDITTTNGSVRHW